MKHSVFSMIVGLASLAAVGAQAADCETTVDSNDKMQFDTDTVTIPASCESFTVKLTHSGSLPASSMGHNWVLTLSDDVQAVAQDGMAAGAENDYVKPGDERVIAYTDIIGGGESTSVTFEVGQLDPDQDYSFLCSFPGHYALMKGKVVVQ